MTDTETEKKSKSYIHGYVFLKKKKNAILLIYS